MAILKSPIYSRLKAPALLVASTTLAWICVSATAQAQLTRDHKLLNSKMPPGIVSQQKLMGNSRLVGHTQPVRIIAPDGSRVAIVADGATTEANYSRVTVGVKAGLLYRFRVDFVDGETPRTVYPSVEIVDRLYAPKGLENQFPVPVVITENDLAQASGGKMVTKVVYLERAESTVPRRPEETEQPWFDVTGAQDPLHVAANHGRPLAILRIGSRVPTAGELAGPSAFDSSRPVVLPDPVETLPMQTSNKPAQTSNKPAQASNKPAQTTIKLTDQLR